MPMGDPAPPFAPGPAIRWHAAPAGDGIGVSPEWQALTGQTEADSRGKGWMACIHPDDLGRVMALWRRARGGTQFTADLRIMAQPAGTWRWFRAQAVQAEAGWSGIAIDVTDLHHRLSGETALRAGLHHRIRNTLAVIRSIARRAAETSESVEDYRNHFDGRLAAFARVQSHIMRSGADRVDLESLLADELLAHQAGGRVRYGGPEVRLPARLADQLGLALHELTDNALQHGALADDEGRLEVRWRIEGAEPHLLHLDWREDLRDGGAAPPPNEGFGLELLTRGLRYEVDAEVVIDFADRGLRCTIMLPLA